MTNLRDLSYLLSLLQQSILQKKRKRPCPPEPCCCCPCSCSCPKPPSPPKPDPCPNSTLPNEPPECELRRQNFQAGNPYTNLDFLFEYRFFNQLRDFNSSIQLCQNIVPAGFRAITVQELAIISNDSKVNGEFLCPMLVWATNNGIPTLVFFAPGSTTPVTIVPTSSLFCRAYFFCVFDLPPTPRPNYREIAIPVPQPEGVTNLPANIFFQIHKNFTAAQEQRIKDAINGVLFHWVTHHNEKWNGGANNGVSQLAACANTYATKNLAPIWYQGPPIPNGLGATNLAMDQFTQLIRDNGFRLSSPAKIDPQISTTIHAETAGTRVRVPLSFRINPKQLDRVDITLVTLAGSMFHAWLHRTGFDDPKLTSYFIAEAPMCIMRGFQPKNPAIPDSSYTQFFD